MRQPARASARTVWRPKKPEPPKIVTRLVFIRLSKSAMPARPGRAEESRPDIRRARALGTGFFGAKPGFRLILTWAPLAPKHRALARAAAIQAGFPTCPDGGIGRRTSFRY